MNLSEITRPDLAVLGLHADRSRIDPLVTNMRQHGFRIWWDVDSILPGAEWEAEVRKIVRSAPIVCLLVSKRSVKSSSFTTTLKLALEGKSRIVPIRLDPIETENLPIEISRRQWINFLNPEDLQSAIQQLERVVASLKDEPKREHAQNSQRATGASSKTPPRPSLELLLGDSTNATTWPMTIPLRTLLENAATYQSTSGDENQFPMSFRTLLMGIFYAGGAWSQWASGIATNTGFDRPKLGALPTSPPPVTIPLRTTRSVASLLDTARTYAQRANTMLDVPHLIAAVVFAPAGHEGELESYGFDKPAWANALVDEATSRSPANTEIFRSLRDEAFPVTKATPNSQQSNITPENASLDQAEPENSQSTSTVIPEWWARASDDLKAALISASGSAGKGDGEATSVGIRDLFLAVLKEGHDGAGLADRLIALIEPKSSNTNFPAWMRVREKLGLEMIFGPPSPDTGVPPVIAIETGRALTRALNLRANPDETLSATLVFLVLFQPQAAGETADADRLLAELGVDGDAFLASIQTQFKQLDRREAAIVREVRDLRSTYHTWDRPHVDNDRVEGAIPPDRDLLDVRKPALRFAKLLAARDVHPPIALGLFGNWGSGKTFFMGLMRDRIADLAKNGGNGYVRRVVQIEFNAWHYHDTNLWASLAMRIFEGLAKELGGKEPSEVEKKRKELHQKISSSAARRDEAQEIRRLALERRSTATQELEAQRTLREQKLREHASLQLAAAWRVVTTSKRFERLRGVADQLAENFGIHVVLGSVEQVRQLKNDIEDTRTHALGVFTAIGRRFDGKSASTTTIGLLVLTLFAALALGWGIEWLDKLGKLDLPQFSGTLVQIATLISTVAAWCGCRVRELRGALDAIGGVEAELAEAEKAVVPDDALKALEAEIGELDKKIHQKSEEVTAAEREIAEATAEIERINRGGLVYDFLQERSAAQTYLGQLGLVSTIRQDLERLDVLLEDFGAHGNNPIERIVLYIDDLDRCHPDKVVEVLQAVHLLLAFDLFNVVVGVDARWLERSLLRQYVGEKDGAARPDDPFSSQDYLEKIFQIPYALAPIGEAGFKTLIGGMIETRTEWRAKERARIERENAEASANETAERNKTQHEEWVNAQQLEEQTDKQDEGAGEEKDAVVENKSDANGEAEPTPATKNEVALFFEDHEESFIQLLYAFVDRPRLAKRFINIYRLLRVRADDEGENSSFAASELSSEFRAALVLLAINVGHPAVAAKVTRAIELAPQASKLATLLADLTKGMCTTVACTERDRDEIAVIIAKLDMVGARVPTELESYRRWAPRVGCFSFDWHRPAPPQRTVVR